VGGGLGRWLVNDWGEAGGNTAILVWTRSSKAKPINSSIHPSCSRRIFIALLFMIYYITYPYPKLRQWWIKAVDCGAQGKGSVAVDHTTPLFLKRSDRKLRSSGGGYHWDILEPGQRCMYLYPPRKKSCASPSVSVLRLQSRDSAVGRRSHSIP